jgi:hypothetical protein
MDSTLGTTDADRAPADAVRPALRAAADRRLSGLSRREALENLGRGPAGR